MKNLGLAGEERIWPGLGWFSGLMCAGSVLGAVAWGANIQALTLLYEPAPTFRLANRANASQNRWLAAYNVLYGLEFVCFIVPKLMILGRLTENSSGSSQAQAADMDRARRWWHRGNYGLRRRALPLLFRAMAAAVVLCSVAAMVALVRAAVYDMQSADLLDQAATACDAAGSATVTSQNFNDEANAIGTNAATAISVQSACEVVALMITAVSYLLLVLRNVAVYRRAEHMSSSALHSMAVTGGRISQVPAVFAESDYAGSAESSVQMETSSALQIVEGTQKAAKEQRRRLVSACAVVLFSFPFRAAFDLLYAYSNTNVSFNPACGLCDPCQSQQFLVSLWIAYTPEFQPVVVALSSPLPLMWSLWLMMSEWERKHLRSGFDVNKTEEQRQAIAARARLGIDLPRPVMSVLHAA